MGSCQGRGSLLPGSLRLRNSTWWVPSYRVDRRAVSCLTHRIAEASSASSTLRSCVSRHLTATRDHTKWSLFLRLSLATLCLNHGRSHQEVGAADDWPLEWDSQTCRSRSLKRTTPSICPSWFFVSLAQQQPLTLFRSLRHNQALVSAAVYWHRLSLRPFSHPLRGHGLEETRTLLTKVWMNSENGLRSAPTCKANCLLAKPGSYRAIPKNLPRPHYQRTEELVAKNHRQVCGQPRELAHWVNDLGLSFDFCTRCLLQTRSWEDQASWSLSPAASWRPSLVRTASRDARSTLPSGGASTGHREGAADAFALLTRESRRWGHSKGPLQLFRPEISGRRTRRRFLRGWPPIASFR